MLIVMAVLMLSLLPAIALGAGEETTLQVGGDRLVATQNLDGGWGWPGGGPRREKRDRIGPPGPASYPSTSGSQAGGPRSRRRR